jgi:hypothetical protein
MEVSMGRDRLEFTEPDSGKVNAHPDYCLYLALKYEGAQFRDLLWEGAIGVPTYRLHDDDSSELFASLMTAPEFPFKARTLRFDYANKVLQFVDLALDHASPDLIIEDVYDAPAFPSGWNVANVDVNVCGEVVKDNAILCLDTGSSRFKGDPKIIEAIIRAVTLGGLLPTYVGSRNPSFEAYPELVLTLPSGEIRVQPHEYFEKLADDYYKLAFHDMDHLPNMLLVGSTFLEHHAPLFFFAESQGTYVGKKVGITL